MSRTVVVSRVGIRPRPDGARTLLCSCAGFLCAILLAGCPSGKSGADGGAHDGGPDSAIAASRALTLLYTNDEHSHLYSFGPEVDDFPTATVAGTGALKGGVARRKVVLDRERAAARAAGADVLTVSAGDNSQGTLAQVEFATTAPDYTVMKQLGYDATCIGNHEFDFGPAALASSINAGIKGGGIPVLVASNLHFSDSDPADDTLAALFGEGTDSRPIQRYHVFTTASGIKVGVFGVLGAEAAYFAPFKTPVRGSGLLTDETRYDLVRPKLYADLQPVVDALRKIEKVDVVVALSHSGLNLDHPDQGDDYLIAENVSGIDVIVSGHSHTVVERPIVVANTKTGRNVIVVQAGSFGTWVGRLQLVLAGDGTVTFDQAGSRLLPVDDTQVPDAQVGLSVNLVMSRLEGGKGAGGVSFLEGALSHVTGTKIVDDATRPGSLYFFPLGKTSFDIPGLKAGVETNLHNLDGDAMYAAAMAALPNNPVDVAIPARGTIRADLQKGKSGVISFADAFRTFPLGYSAADGTVGYPLVHTYLFLVEVKAAFEVSASLGFTQTDFFLGSSGMRVTIDTTRPAFDPANPAIPTNGRVTRIEYDSLHRAGADTYDTVLFDVARADPWTSGKFDYLSLIHVVTDLYIASFAASQGVTLKDKNGVPMKLLDGIVKRADGSEVKEYEAFSSYIKSVCDLNGGALPSRYDGSTPQGAIPRRILCSGPLCGK